MEINFGNGNGGNGKLARTGTDIVATFTSWVNEGLKPDLYNPGKTRDTIKLVYRVPLEDGTEGEQFEWVRNSSNEKSTLYDVVRALLGGKRPNGVVSLNSQIDKQLLIDIAGYESKGKRRTKVTAHRPYVRPNLHNVAIDDNDLPEGFGK